MYSNSLLEKVKELIYTKCSLIISDFKYELEGKEYKACSFKLNNANIICRNAKVTPKKNGQFVTFWRRNKEGITVPFNESSSVNFYVVNVKYLDKNGQFVFPKSILIEKGIIATSKKDGKRGFRVYPPWDVPKSTQALKTQKWQLEYFFEIKHNTNLLLVKKLYSRQ